MTEEQPRVPAYDAPADIYRRAGIEKVTFAKLSASRWCPDPDVRIGSRPGWNPYRSNRWLRETGRVDIHGRPSRATRIGRPGRQEEPPDWYTKQPLRLLTASEAALVLGMERKIIHSLRKVGIGPAPAARIGTGEACLEGYTFREIVRTGLQHGWLREEEIEEIRERMLRLKRLDGTPYRTAAGLAFAA